ncbi:MAG: methylenetetrahydrofolate reductase C-terminal domain-containing protein [Chloroflexi bacterium]|nr:methylenetetrahydrofolate reductase C-terminal domain-containing protein [Chloroflexota bacterium]
MILSRQKPWEEILGYLDGESKVFLLGCNGCAQASGTGGPVQVAEMKGNMEGAGKKVTGSAVVDFLCEKALVKSKLRTNIEVVQAADSILVMTCGVGVQATAAAVNKVCHPACDTINLGGSRGEWSGSERCMECGECVLESTGGICPLTACTKGLLSGQCGGSSKGKCEVNPERDCGWVLIYNRLKSINQLDKLRRFVPPKNYGKMIPDVKVMATTFWALERTAGKEAVK